MIVKIKQYTFLTLFCVWALLISSSVSPEKAAAASSYDSLVHTTDALVISDGDGGSVDISQNWKKILAECNSAASASLEGAIQNGDSWLIMQENGIHGDAYIRWTSDNSVYTSFFLNILGDPSWGTSPGTLSVARINWHNSTGQTGCEYYPVVMNYQDEALITPSNSGNMALYLSTYLLSYPAGYEGATIPTQPPAAKYVAMGDSFSSGEGNPPFEFGTDENDVNECHRSSQAYPRLLEFDSSLDLGSTAFVACSGATTANVLYGGLSEGAWDESAQVDALSDDTEVVTLTVGGNDVGFKEYAEICAVSPCGPGLGQLAYDAIMDNVNASAFLGSLETTYESILENAPNADVYILDYPFLFDPTGEDSTGCVVADAAGATLVQTALDATISLAVAEVRSESTDYRNRLHYVSTNQFGSPFKDKHLCTDNLEGSSFNPVYLPPFWNSSYSLHPNNKGHENYYQTMKELIG